MKMTRFIVWGLLLVAVIACESKFPQNGKLDGMWKVTAIERNDGSVETPDRMFYSVQLKLISLRSASAGERLGYFQYNGDSLKIDMRQGTNADMLKFGMKGLKDTFAIETLTSSKMVLYNGETRLRFVIF